jgi:hypothetical protein
VARICADSIPALNIFLIKLSNMFMKQNGITPAEEERRILKGQSHEKVGEMRVWGISLGPN